jgi:polysaccharide biosynthesis/export protein
MNLRQIALLACILFVNACAELPASGPSARAIEAGAKVENYAVIDVTPQVIDQLRGRLDPSFAGSFGSGAGGGSNGTLNIGDQVEITIWEAGNGGLFSSETSLGGGSKSVRIPAQPVSRSGTVFVPYVGEIPAAGRSPSELQNAIVAGLSGKAIEPQALVSVSRSSANTVTVVGEGTHGGRIPLTTGRDRLLDVVAAAGPLGGRAHEIFVQYTRGNRSARVSMLAVIEDPKENILVRPGDTITLVNEPQSYTVLGATGRNAEVRFTSRRVSLAEALAGAGGLLDLRADPRGIFLFRREPREFVQRMDPENALLQTSASTIPVVYRLDLLQPNALFLAKDFRVIDKDVLYISNAPATELQKFLLVLNDATNVSQDVLSIRTSLRN